MNHLRRSFWLFFFLFLVISGLVGYWVGGLDVILLLLTCRGHSKIFFSVTFVSTVFFSYNFTFIFVSAWHFISSFFGLLFTSLFRVFFFIFYFMKLFVSGRGIFSWL